MTTNHKSSDKATENAAKSPDLATTARGPAAEQTHVEGGITMRADNTRADRPDMDKDGNIVNPAATPASEVDIKAVAGEHSLSPDAGDHDKRQTELDDAEGQPLTAAEQQRVEALTGRRLQAPAPKEDRASRRTERHR